MSEAYDRLAGVYDHTFRGNVCRAEDEVMRRQLDLQPGARVLDVGCGTGLLLELFPHLAEPGSGYLGIDVSPQMLAQAREKFPRAQLLQVDVQEMSSLWSGPVDPESFDVVVSLHTLSHAADPEIALIEIWNALAPGGRYYLTFFSERYRRRPSYIMNQHGLSTHAAFHTVETVCELLDRAGFAEDGYEVTGLNAWADQLTSLPAPAIAAWMSIERRLVDPERCFHLVVEGRKASRAAA